MSLIAPLSAKRLIVVISTLAAAGCAMEDREERPFTVQDSAGVRIVHNRAPAWDAASTWHVSPTPILELGAAEAISRVAMTVRLSDDRIVVAERADNSILVYSENGELPSRFGRTGTGPAEFRELSRLYRFGETDSLLVFDFGLSRASVFSPDGDLLREFSTVNARSGLAPLIAGVFDDGSLLVADVPVPTPDLRGLVRSTVSLRRYDPEFDRSNPITQFPGRETYFQDTPWGQVDMRQPYFGHTAAYIAGGERVYWAITDTFAIHVLDAFGRLRALIYKTHEAARPSSSMVDQLIDRQLSGVQDENAQRQARGMLDAMPVSDQAPTFGWPAWAQGTGANLQLDREGNLWVVKYFMPGADENARLVFNAGGEWLGTVQLPRRFSPSEIGADYIIGVSRDSLDVEHVQLYRLIKP